jgi:ribonuclease HI
MLTLYTDGAVSGNGKENAYGGWGWYCKETQVQEFGAIPTGATNQICELMAVIRACEYANETTIDMKEDGFFSAPAVTIRTDSAYIFNCWKDKWYKSWQRNDWKNSKKEPVANKDLWEQLIPFFENPQFYFEKVKGHSGEFGNEMADELACKGKAKAKEILLND